MEFATLELHVDEADQLKLLRAAARELLEARPEALALTVQFELLRDEDEEARLVLEWAFLYSHGQNRAPAVDVIELELWAFCWAIERFPFDHLLLRLLEREGSPSLDRLLAQISRGVLLLWPEALVFLEDQLRLTQGGTGAYSPSPEPG